jgi:hypothetical protein
MTTQKDVLRKAFTKGKTLTAKQIASQYQIASPSKVISRLRDEGMDIRNTKHVNSKGDVTFKYALQGLPRMSSVGLSRAASKKSSV